MSSAPLEPHPTTQRLPQEPLSGLQLRLIQHEVIPENDGGNDQTQLHLSNVPAHARSRTSAERDKALFLPVREPSQPPLGLELVSVRTPDRVIVVNGVTRDGERGAGGEVLAKDGDARARGHDARQPERGGGVDAEGFVDGGAKVGQMLDGGEVRDGRRGLWKRGREFSEEGRQDVGSAEAVV